jgi:nucleotidyltransferase substrate binding protein (TIGR01987 family)
MTKYDLQLEQFKKATSRLDEVLGLSKTEITRDSAIQRFEFCLDLSWKTLQTYLKDNKGIVSNSPKDTFREAYQNNLISYPEDWIKLVILVMALFTLIMKKQRKMCIKSCHQL